MPCRRRTGNRYMLSLAGSGEPGVPVPGRHHRKCVGPSRSSSSSSSHETTTLKAAARGSVTGLGWEVTCTSASNAAPPVGLPRSPAEQHNLAPSSNRHQTPGQATLFLHHITLRYRHKAGCAPICLSTRVHGDVLFAAVVPVRRASDRRRLSCTTVRRAGPRLPTWPGLVAASLPVAQR